VYARVVVTVEIRRSHEVRFLFALVGGQNAQSRFIKHAGIPSVA